MVETGKAERVQEGPTEVTVAEALAIAVQMHSEGQLDVAETIYRRILELLPDEPDALNFLGMLVMIRGRREEALDLIQRSLAADPTLGVRYVNLGNVLLSLERVDEAVAAFERAIEEAPDSATAYSNVGVAYMIQRRLDDAERAYRRAIELDPTDAGAHNNYGNLLAARGDVRGGIRQHLRAVELRPRDPNMRRALGVAYAAIGELEGAIKVYREWLEYEPDNPIARYLLAACQGEDVPRATDDFIEQSFDVFADSFDSKLAGLGYRAPELVEAALRRAGIPAEKRLAVLDAGCGTGLCGPLVAPYAARLDGVDLSNRMLERARSRGMYDDLKHEELTKFLESCSAAYDVVLSADTLCYFGPLAAVFRAAAGALKPGGWIAFSVERADESEAPQGHRLHPCGRYAHTRRYVTRALAESGFEQCDVVEDVLRQEAGAPVNGLVVVARKATSHAVE